MDVDRNIVVVVVGIGVGEVVAAVVVVVVVVVVFTVVVASVVVVNGGAGGDVPAVDIFVLFEVCCCLSLLAMGIGSSLVSMMLVEAMDELKNLEVISLMSPLLECDDVTFVMLSGVTLVVETVVVGTAVRVRIYSVQSQL